MTCLVVIVAGATSASNEVSIEEEPDWDDEENIVKGLTCIYIVGIEDPVRAEVG